MRCSQGGFCWAPKARCTLKVLLLSVTNEEWGRAARYAWCKLMPRTHSWQSDYNGQMVNSRGFTCFCAVRMIASSFHAVSSLLYSLMQLGLNLEFLMLVFHTHFRGAKIHRLQVAVGLNIKDASTFLPGPLDRSKFATSRSMAWSLSYYLVNWSSAANSDARRGCKTVTLAFWVS